LTKKDRDYNTTFSYQQQVGKIKTGKIKPASSL